MIIQDGPDYSLCTKNIYASKYKHIYRSISFYDEKDIGYSSSIYIKYMEEINKTADFLLSSEYGYFSNLDLKSFNSYKSDYSSLTLPQRMFYLKTLYSEQGNRSPHIIL